MKIVRLTDEYSNFTYPVEFRKIVELNLINFEMWYFMDETQVRTRITGLKTRYPNRKLIPFARGDDRTHNCRKGALSSWHTIRGE